MLTCSCSVDCLCDSVMWIEELQQIERDHGNIQKLEEFTTKHWCPLKMCISAAGADVPFLLRMGTSMGI